MFLGSEGSYTLLDSFTDSRLHAQFNFWAALEPRCSNEAFNVVKGDIQLWQTIWPKLAMRVHCHIPRNQFRVNVPDSESVMKLAEKPPIADYPAGVGFEENTRQSEIQ